MQTKVFMLNGRKEVKNAMLATMGITSISDFEKWEKAQKKELTDKTFERLLISRHSPINQMRFCVESIVPERVHTHIVRHHKTDIYVATSRPDIHYHKDISNGYRVLNFVVDAKRLIEICWLRLCDRSWIQTIEYLNLIKENVCKIDNSFSLFLNESCVWFGFCVETNNCCGYINSSNFQNKRNSLILKAQELSI